MRLLKPDRARCRNHAAAVADQQALGFEQRHARLDVGHGHRPAPLERGLDQVEPVERRFPLAQVAHRGGDRLRRSVRARLQSLRRLARHSVHPSLRGCTRRACTPGGLYLGGSGANSLPTRSRTRGRARPLWRTDRLQGMLDDRRLSVIGVLVSVPASALSCSAQTQKAALNARFAMLDFRHLFIPLDASRTVT